AGGLLVAPSLAGAGVESAADPVVDAAGAAGAAGAAVVVRAFMTASSGRRVLSRKSCWMFTAAYSVTFGGNCCAIGLRRIVGVVYESTTDSPPTTSATIARVTVPCSRARGPTP